jgi:hypothetical protein
MTKGKIQITDDGFRDTSTKLTDTDHGHERRSEGTAAFFPTNSGNSTGSTIDKKRVMGYEYRAVFRIIR